MAGTYIVNPRRRRTTRKRRTPPRGPGGRFRRRRTTRRTRRNPTSLATYLPNRRRTRRRYTYRPRRRTYRRNPSLKRILPFSVGEFLAAGAGAIVTRQVTDMVLKTRNRGPMGYAGNVLVGIGLGMAAKKVKALRGLGKALALGSASFTAARIMGETVLKRAGIAGMVEGVGMADLGSDMGYVDAPAMAVVPGAGGLIPYAPETAVVEDMELEEGEDYPDYPIASEWSDFSLGSGLSADDPWDAPA